MSRVVVDADVLGRRRTGDETYVRNLLRELAPLASEAGLELLAVTRRPELVPAGVEPVELRASSQELRMALSLPRLLRRERADLVHTQYALPVRCPCPAVVTVHDLSFAEPGLMGRKDRLVFTRVVPRAVRGAARVLTVSERGFGKRTSSYEYRVSGRGGKGIGAMVVNDRNGALVASFPVEGEDQIVLVTDAGQLIRCPVDDVRIAGRNTQGVRIFKTDDEEKVVSVERVPEEGSSENGNGTENGNADGGNDGEV